MIGEGEKDKRRCSTTARSVGDGTPPLVDVAVDPIDGTTLTAMGRTNALSVIAVSERESMFDPGPSYYMEKIAVGPEAVGAIDITASASQNLRWIAKSAGERPPTSPRDPRPARTPSSSRRSDRAGPGSP